MRRKGDWWSVAAAIAVAGVSLAAASWILRVGSDGTTATPDDPSVQLESLSDIPSVLSRAFVGLPVAAHDRDVLVGIGARRQGPVDVVIIPSDETEVPPDDVQVRVGTTGEWVRGTAASPCGRRCLRFPLNVVAGTPSTLEVEVERPEEATTRVSMRLPPDLPVSADELLRRARTRMLALHTYTMDETLDSGLAPASSSRWSLQAPDRFQYTTSAGSRAVVIGSRRWDWQNGRWEPTRISKLRVPAFSWQGARQPRILRRSRLGSTPVTIVAAQKPGADFPTWFRLYVADSGQVLRSEMLTTAHFMVDRYGNFNTAPPVRPPR